MYKLVKEILLKLIPGKLHNLIISEIKKNNRRQSEQLPRYKIQSKHIENAKLLINREDLLHHLPKGGIVAELGVDEGTFSAIILKVCEPKKLYLIDSWETKQSQPDKKRRVENKFTKEIKSGTIEINTDRSIDAVKRFQDNYFDWIYIDTDHSYKSTKEELEAYESRVKPNGIITGHDYISGNWDDMIKYGVIEAVHEFCLKYNWEIIYITVDVEEHPSFAIRRKNILT